MYASIDIGTNTVLLLVADVQGDALQTLHEEQRIPRLGKRVDASRNLAPDSIDRVISALKDYRQILESRFPAVAEVTVTATSAVRDANNRRKFVDRVKEETGFNILVLSGLEEADYTFTGALSMLPDLSAAAVIDIGGGSTEVVFGQNNNLTNSHSFDMGSVRFTERYLLQDPPSQKEILRCRESVKEMLKERAFNINFSKSNLPLVGVAGTVTSLAYIEQKLSRYEAEQINGHQIRRHALKEHIAELSTYTSKELTDKYPAVMQGRADVFLGGLLVLEGFMDYYNVSELTVSTGGIRHGAILKEAASSK